jgi:hypothetical protein
VSDTLSLTSNIPLGHPVREAYFELLDQEDNLTALSVNDVIFRLRAIPSSRSAPYIDLLSQLLSRAGGPLKTRVVEEVREIIGSSANNPNIQEMQAIIGDTPSRVRAAAPSTTVGTKLGLNDNVPGSTNKSINYLLAIPVRDDEIGTIIELLDNDQLDNEARTKAIAFLRNVPTQDSPSEEAKRKAREYIARFNTPDDTAIPTGSGVDTSKGDASKLTTKQEPTITYPPAADWGMRVTQVDTNKNYFFSLLPAMDSVIPMTASKDVPNALPGLHIRVKANIAKLRVPGSTPIYQHMGIDSVMITVVGMFTGVDGDKPSPATYLSHATGKDKVGTLMAKLDTYGAMQSFYEHAYLSGADLDVEINMARYQAFDVKEGVIRSAKTGNPRFRGHLSLLEVAHARSDRTYYTLQFETRSLTEDKCEITKIEHIPASLSLRLSQAAVEEQTSAVESISTIINDIEMAKRPDSGKTISEWESGDPDPSGRALRVNEVCDNDGKCRYYVFTPGGQLYEETNEEEIDKLKNERIGGWNSNRLIRTGAGIAATVTACTVAVGSIPAAVTIVGGVLTAAAAAGCGATAGNLINTVVNGDNRQYTPVEAAIDAVTILAPTKVGTASLGKVVGVGAKVASAPVKLAGRVVSKTGILRTGPAAKITSSLAQSTQGVRRAIFSTANRAKNSAVNFALSPTPAILRPPSNYLSSSNVAARFTRFITPGLGPASNVTNAVDDASQSTGRVTTATSQTNNIVDDAVTNATRSTLTRSDIPNIDKVSRESGDIAIQMRNENISIDDASRWIAENYSDANPGEVLRARQIIRNNVDFPVEDDPASLATALYKEGYNPQDMGPDELINYIRNARPGIYDEARPGISDEVVTSLKNRVLSEYNEKYPRAITEEGVYNNIIEIANTLSPDATQAQKLEALKNISDKEGALRVLNEVLDRRLTGNIRVTSVRPPEEVLPPPLNPDGTPTTLGPAAGSIDGEPIVIVDHTFSTTDSIVPIPTNTLTAPATPVESPGNIQTNTGAAPVSAPASPANKVISITGGGVISKEAVANDIAALIPDVGNLPDAVLRNVVMDYLEGNQAIYNTDQVNEIVNIVKQNNPGSPVIPRVANTDDIQDMQLPNEPGTPTNQVVGQAPDTTTGRATINDSIPSVQIIQIAENQAQAILNANPDIDPDTLSNNQILALVDVAFAIDFNKDPFAVAVRNYIKILK